MEADQHRFGQLLRQRRKQQQMTLRDLEELSGVSYSQLSKIERGESVPLRTNVERIAGALGGYRNELLYSAGYLPDMDYIYALKGDSERSEIQQSSLTVQEQAPVYARQEIEQFTDWLGHTFAGMPEDHQRQVLAEARDFVQFKKFQLDRARND